MSAGARYEIHPGRLPAAGAVCLSLAAHAVAIAAVLLFSTITANVPLQAIRVTLITVAPERAVETNLNEYSPRQEAAITPPPADLPLPDWPIAEVAEAPAAPPEKPMAPPTMQNTTPARNAGDVDLISSKPAKITRLSPLDAAPDMVAVGFAPAELHEIEFPPRDFAALTAKLTGPPQPVAHGPILDAALVADMQPRYPVLARRRGYQGRVVISASVLPSGAVEYAFLVTSSGFDVLDDAALDAVSMWRLLPARRDGKAVDGTIEIPIDFVLR